MITAPVVASRKLSPRAVTSGVLVISSGALAMVASVLSWWTVSISGPLFQVGRTYLGVHAWVGWGTLVAGIGLLVAGTLFLSAPRMMGPRFFAAHCVTLGLGVAAFAVIGIVERGTLVNVLGASPGFAGGVFVVLAAGFAAVVGGVLAGPVPATEAQVVVPPPPPPPAPQFAP